MAEKLRYFRDERVPETLISEDKLKREYGALVADGSIDPSEKNFAAYLTCCLQVNGGTLTEVSTKKAHATRYAFLIRETSASCVDVEATSFKEAKKEVYRLYENGEFDLDHNCFAFSEVLPCCAECGESCADEDDYDLREVDAETPDARMMCTSCVEHMETTGELTRCECCGNVFSPKYLKVNTESGVPEICPICGKVWCE